MQVIAQVLGEVRILADGSPVDLGGPRQRRLLAALLTHHGSPMSTDRLVETLFDGEPPDAAWRSFRTYVSRLRRALEAGGVDASTVVATVPSGYTTPADLELDSERFECLLQVGRRRLDKGDAGGALTSLEQALALWSGSAFVEFADAEWARPEALRLDELRLVARELHASAMVDSGRHAEAIAEIRALVASEPLREEPRRLLMCALYRSGRHAEALRAGREFRAQLADETGLEWSPALAELERMIVDRDPRLDASPPGRRLRDYVLGDVLASTPNGVTYRASQPSVGRDVAITVIPTERADDPDFVRRFEAQAQQIAAVEHPNVVPVYDYWREPGEAYVVTRYLAGGTLAERLWNGPPVDADEATQIVVNICEALRAAAEHGVHHGRLTPATVLFDQRGGAHLAGFSLNAADDAEARDIDALATIAELLRERVAGRVPDDAGVQRVALVRDVAARAGQHAGSSRIVEVVDRLIAAAQGKDLTAVSGSVLESAFTVLRPYRGLHAFAETDADVFFGRRAMVEQVAADLQRNAFVVLVGPSGSGKSSFVRAGLLPKLHASGSYVAAMVPGRHPIAQLEIALSRVAIDRVPDLTPLLDHPDGLPGVLADVLPGEDPRLVLLVDQLEEAVTMSDPVERDLLFEVLARAVNESDGGVQVVATVRADFLGRLLDHPVLGRLIRDHTRLIAPLDAHELHEAIVEPAARVGVSIEPALVTALVADSSDAPGSLPLLQFALTELFERRTDGVMSLAAYREMGGLGAPIAQSAEGVYHALADGEREEARRLFSRLIAPGEGAEDTRRRVVRSELATISPDVLDAFGVARLLTFDRHPRTREPTVEIAHEALIAHWPRLGSWVDEDRGGLLVLRHLTNSARAWDAASQDASELYRGGRLAIAEEWVAHHGEDLNPLERAFLDGSVRARDDEIEGARRRARRLRELSSGLALIAVVALVAVVIAVVQQNRADRNAGRAERSRVAADVQRLLAQANATLDEDPDLPILLALEAYDRQQRTGEPPSGNLLATMQTAVQNSRILRRTDDVTGDPSALSPDGTKMALLAADDWTAAVVVDVESGAELGRIETNSEIYSLYFDPSGERLVTVQGYHPEPRGEIRFHDLSSFEEVGRTSRVPFNFQWVDLSPDGRYAAAAELGVWNVGEVPRTTVVWDLSDLDGAPVQHDNVNIGGWLPDGETLVVHDEDTIGFVDPLTGEDRRPRLDVGKVYSVGVHPEREELVVLGDDLELWRLGETASFRVLADAAFVGPTGMAVFTPDGTRIVVHGIDDTVRIIEPDSGETLVLKGNTNSAEVAMSADGARLLVGGEDGSILWDLTPAGPAASGNLPSEGRISQIALGGDSSRATVAEFGLGTDGTLARVRRFDLDTGAALASSGALDASEIVTSNAGWYAYAPPGGPARIGHLDDERVASELDHCDVPEAIDDQGRWLLVAVDDQQCDVTSTRLVDPSTGAELLELRNHHAEDAEFGPSGTIADGLLAYRAVDSLNTEETIGIILRRISPGDESLGALLEYDLSKPQFSADGRYLSVDSEESGTYVIDVELVLAGDRMSDAIVGKPRGTGGGTTSSVVGGGWVVLGQSGEVLRFYDLESGAEWMTLPIDSDGSTHFRITAEERALYYESAGGVLRRFPLDHRELADLARRRVHRGLTEAECFRFEIADECSDWVTN